ncbi:MAG: phage tail sheath C-terminal domain-containing protein [Ginsengibacter sp.]
MPEYKTPGVYIEEIPKLPPSIASVETAIPAFIGYTARAREKTDGDLVNKGLRISSMLEYVQYFGGADPENGIEVTFSSIAGKTEIHARVDPEKQSKFLMYYSLQMFFANGGGPCYIVSVGDYASTGSLVMVVNLGKGLSVVEKIDEVTLILFPDAINLSTAIDYYNLYTDAIAQAKKLQDRFVVMDVWHDPDNINAENEIEWKKDIDLLRNRLSGATEDLKYAAAYFPRIRTSIDFQYKVKDSEKNDDDDAKVIVKGSADGSTLAELKAGNNTQYFQAKSAINNLDMILPASSAVVGVYAQVDSSRGVWKAPANVNINYAVGPEFLVTHEEQMSLNVDAKAGKSINVIRSFPGRGSAIIWGSRTLAGNDNEWRYIPVRRFFNMVEESTKNATEQFVFEPNDLNTWTRVKSMIINYLTQQWKAGALQGTTTREAFYVHVGLAETMTYQDVLEGRMIVEIGMAVVRPAEFIILRFMHKMLEET